MIRKGILLDGEFGVRVANKTLKLGDTQDQDAAIVLSSNPGDLKEDPLIGAGLNKFIRSDYDSLQIENRIRQQLNRAGIDYDTYKERLLTTIKTTE